MRHTKPSIYIFTRNYIQVTLDSHKCPEITQYTTVNCHKNASACRRQSRAYSEPSLLNKASCVPVSTIAESFIYLLSVINQVRRIRKAETKTYRMRSACRVRFPNLCVENIIVLFPRNSRSRENRSSKKQQLRYQ